MQFIQITVGIIKIKGIPLALRTGTGRQKGHTGFPKPGTVQLQVFLC
jgi:hypothetical protein